MNELIFRERPADGPARGLLMLNHGRGSDEHDLFGLADLFDPKRRLHVVAPRAPYEFEGGYRWYATTAPGLPEPESFKPHMTAWPNSTTSCGNELSSARTRRSSAASARAPR